MNKNRLTISVLALFIAGSCNIYAQKSPILIPGQIVSKTVGQPQTVKMPSMVSPWQQISVQFDNKSGSFFASTAKQNIAENAVLSHLNELLNLSDDYSFIQTSQKTDNYGFTHTVLKQYFNGIPVDGANVILHSKNGQLTSINGQIISNIDEVSNPEITPQFATNFARIYMRLKLFNQLHEAIQNTTIFADENVETVIANISDNNGSKGVLAYKVRVETRNPLGMYNIFVGAEKGAILKKISLITDVDVPAVGHTLYSGQQSMTCTQSSGEYILQDSARNLQTFDATSARTLDRNTYTFPGATLFKSSTGVFGTVANPVPQADIHWNLEKSIDYYRDTFARNSYDDSGGLTRAFYNTLDLQVSMGNNAYAMESPYNLLAIGSGDGTDYGPFASLDIVGHEFSHLVVFHNGIDGLAYEGESGALNESFADIFGTCIEFSAHPTPAWTLGDQISLTGETLRSMADPKSTSTKQPNTYRGQYWIAPDTTFDNGGVHINSGVQNYWFYLLSNGGSGVNDLGNSYTVNAIGLSKAQRIAYRTLTNYLPKYARYWDAYKGSLQATEDLYGNPSAEYTAVEQAWYAVGLDSSATFTCMGMKVLTKSSGTFSDGTSEGANYSNNLDCRWLIQVDGANEITLNFTRFDTEFGHDTVFVYDGNSDSDPCLLAWHGGTLPSLLVKSTGNRLLVKFVSDSSVNASGWEAHYYSDIDEVFCSATTVLSGCPGSFSDGSGQYDYGNNYECMWVVMFEKIDSVKIWFSEFDVHPSDALIVYTSMSSTKVYTNSSMPPDTLKMYPLMYAGYGALLFKFQTDASQTAGGFTVHYDYVKSSNDVQTLSLKNQLQIYPIPASSELKIKNYQLKDGETVEIVDVLGRVQQTSIINQQSEIIIDVSHLAKGMYFVRIGNWRGKFVVN
ncbi:MAG: M4 family metallopeptidase [Bacteroidales bacterium]|jgi:Zn-dependent metalloprotease|nr:M4 family metallopeptidase [Bacteroidales bacterium]